MSRLTFYSRPGCPLCEEELEKVKRVARRFGLPVEEIDIRSDEALRSKRGADPGGGVPGWGWGWGWGWGRVSEKRLQREIEKRLG